MQGQLQLKEQNKHAHLLYLRDISGEIIARKVSALQHFFFFLDDLTFQLFLGASYKRPNRIK